MSILNLVYGISARFSVLLSSLESTQLVVGTKNLTKDATTVLLILLPTVCVICVIVFQILCAVSDEQGQVQWKKRSKLAVICTIIGECAAGLIYTLVSYYQ